MAGGGRFGPADRASGSMFLSELASGWTVLLGALLGIASGVFVIFHHTFGVLLPFMSTEFGGGKTQWSALLTILSIFAAVSAPIVGQMVDRFGTARIAVPSLLLSAVAFLAASRLVDSYQAMIVFVLVIGILGSGTHNATYLYALGGYFQRSRGLAIGIVLSGTGLCGAVAPILVMRAVEANGWRAGYVVIAAILLVAALVVVALLRNTVSRVNAQTPVGDGGSAVHWGSTLAEARRTVTFWKAMAVLFLFSFATTGQLPHLVSIALSQGLTAGRAAGFASITGVAIIVGRITAGLLMDRIQVRFVGVGFMLVSALGLGLMATGNAAYLPVGIMLLGLGLGAEVDLAGYIVARYFGNKHYGSIFGWLFLGYASGSMLSPVTAGFIYDLTGSYTAGLVFAMCVLLAAIPVMLTFRRPPDV